MILIKDESGLADASNDQSTDAESACLNNRPGSDPVNQVGTSK